MNWLDESLRYDIRQTLEELVTGSLTYDAATQEIFEAACKWKEDRVKQFWAEAQCE